MEGRKDPNLENREEARMGNRKEISMERWSQRRKSTCLGREVSEIFAIW